MYHHIFDCHSTNKYPYLINYKATISNSLSFIFISMSFVVGKYPRNIKRIQSHNSKYVQYTRLYRTQIEGSVKKPFIIQLLLIFAQKYDNINFTHPHRIVRARYYSFHTNQCRENKSNRRNHNAITRLNIQ